MSRILVINPGSTSTKIAVYENENLKNETTLRHSVEEINEFDTLYDQKDFRKRIIVDFLNESDYDISDFDAIIGRGGLLKPIESGTYDINEKMIDHLKKATYGEHASNLGGILAKELAEDRISSFIADPVVVDEMSEIARLSGHPDYERKSIFHALNQKAVAREVSKRSGENYEDINLIVVHIGGGISIGAHCKGRVIDVNNALNGEGPYSPERSGTLPLTGLINICFSEGNSYNRVKKIIKGKGGLYAYTGTNSGMEINEEIKEGNEEYEKYYLGMGYQIVKWIGQMTTVLKGDVRMIIFTGGLAHDMDILMPFIIERVSFIAPMEIIPGGDEERALALAALRVLNNDESAKEYV
jgi:butyrate kinase